MANVIVSLIVIIAGSILIYYGIHEIEKKDMKLVIEGKTVLEEYYKYMRWVDIGTGVISVIIGISALLKLMTGETAGLIVCLICLLNRILQYVIEKKYII
jgi:hypothetical protein